jgi:hypothetical protein
VVGLAAAGDEFRVAVGSNPSTPSFINRRRSCRPDRLAEIKRRYDPTNPFRRNQNVAPAADGAGA